MGTGDWGLIPIHYSNYNYKYDLQRLHQGTTVFTHKCLVKAHENHPAITAAGMPCLHPFRAALGRRQQRFPLAALHHAGGLHSGPPRDRQQM